jgi:hypothetical protein
VPALDEGEDCHGLAGDCDHEAFVLRREGRHHREAAPAELVEERRLTLGAARVLLLVEPDEEDAAVRREPKVRVHAACE